MADQARADLLVALGLAVRELRLERGLSQERLAELAGLHPRYVSDVERGRRNVGFVNVYRIAGALSVDVSALVRRVDARRAGTSVRS
jgi:transcriptional regulator with XRE-family HTH domain